MGQEMFPIKVRTRYTSGLIENLREWLKNEAGIDYPRDVIERSISAWVEARVDTMIESLPETLTSPNLAEAQEFRRVLDRYYTESEASRTEAAEAPSEPATVFTGSRAFSKEKLGAMIAYLVAHGRDVYKTNLNKLLFYSDLTFYYLKGHGMSGATYVNLPYGPVPDGIDSLIGELVDNGSVHRSDVPEFGPAAQRLTAGESSADTALASEEKDVLDWVLANYGEMSASELSEYSHHEKAYKFTRPLEPIAYEYAKFFKKLPPKNN